jgi:hypothetical protein
MGGRQGAREGGRKEGRTRKKLHILTYVYKDADSSYLVPSTKTQQQMVKTAASLADAEMTCVPAKSHHVGRWVIKSAHRI